MDAPWEFAPRAPVQGPAGIVGAPELAAIPPVGGARNCPIPRGLPCWRGLEAMAGEPLLLFARRHRQRLAHRRAATLKRQGLGSGPCAAQARVAEQALVGGAESLVVVAGAYVARVVDAASRLVDERLVAEVLP